MTEYLVCDLIHAVAQIAQSVEQGIENPRVGGSIPSLGTIKFYYPFLKAQIAQSVEQGIENPRVGGSIPSLGTISKPNFKKSELLTQNSKIFIG